MYAEKLCVPFFLSRQVTVVGHKCQIITFYLWGIIARRVCASFVRVCRQRVWFQSYHKAIHLFTHMLYVCSWKLTVNCNSCPKAAGCVYRKETVFSLLAVQWAPFKPLCELLTEWVLLPIICPPSHLSDYLTAAHKPLWQPRRGSLLPGSANMSSGRRLTLPPGDRWCPRL